MRATRRIGVSLRDLLPEEEAAAMPTPAAVASAGDSAKPLVLVEKLVKEYPRQGATATLAKLFSRKPPVELEQFRAVDGISFSVGHGESVGLVGESGCGKSTTSMMVMRLLAQTSGRILFDGDEIGGILPNAFARLPLRKSIQMASQDPTDSLNPRFTAARATGDPIMKVGDIRGRDALRARCEELGGLVGLPVNLLDRFPHQLSGGQKARVGIARAIALHPKLVILDEPTAALDVSVQAVVLNLLQDLKASMGMSYLFVSHDLNVVRLLCDRVIVMRTGRIVEQGPSEQVPRQFESAMPGTSAKKMAKAERGRKMTGLAATEAALARIAEHDSALNSFTDVTADRARAKARAVDAAIAVGQRVGPLAGVPFAVKNLFDVQGLPTRAGSKINRDLKPASRDATLVERMEAAGAVLVGALDMGEYAYDFTGENVHDGPS